MSEEQIQQVENALDGKPVLFELACGDVVRLRRNWHCSACQGFGGPPPEAGNIGVVWHVGKGSSFGKGLEPIWVTFPNSGKYCVYRECLKLERSRWGDMRRK
jgi:hypothetical protein